MDDPPKNDVEMSIDVNEGNREDIEQNFNTDKEEATTSQSMDIDENINTNQNGDGIENLLLKFKNLNVQKFCCPEYKQQTTHFSDLPFELILHILTYYANDANDINHLKMLDQYAAVCRGWYICARDSAVYRQACSRLWSENIMHLENYGGSWRRMLIERQPVFTTGCYIATIQNHNSDRCYYYLKFYSDGRFVNLATELNPEIMAGKFEQFEDKPLGAVWGFYEYCNRQIRLNFCERPNWGEHNVFDSALKHINRITLKIMDYDTKRNCKLMCEKLEIVFDNGVKANVFTRRVPPHMYFIQ